MVQDAERGGSLWIGVFPGDTEDMSIPAGTAVIEGEFDLTLESDGTGSKVVKDTEGNIATLSNGTHKIAGNFYTDENGDYNIWPHLVVTINGDTTITITPDDFACFGFEVSGSLILPGTETLSEGYYYVHIYDDNNNDYYSRPTYWTAGNRTQTFSLDVLKGTYNNIYVYVFNNADCDTSLYYYSTDSANLIVSKAVTGYTVQLEAVDEGD